MSFPEIYPIPITNPAELALSRADVVAASPQDEITQQEEELLIELDAISTASGFDGSYFIETGLALAIPIQWERDKPVNIIHFTEGLSFEGDLTTYGVCKVGRLAVGNSDIQIRALCLVFDNATLLPFFDRLDDDKLLYVPAYAVDDIDSTRAA